MKCALITAGGCGTRLYPLSTKDCPKQFVRMFGDKSLLQLTYERLSKYFDKDNILEDKQSPSDDWKKWKRLIKNNIYKINVR